MPAFRPLSSSLPARLPALALCALTLALAAAGGAPARATMFVPIADAALADGAPVILEGRILALEVASGERPAVDYRVRIERPIKGDLPPGPVVVRVPGGVRPDGLALLIRGAPRFRAGDDVLLFLEPRRDGTFGLHQLMLGAFRVETVAGVRVARRDLSGALEVKPPGAQQPADGPRDVLKFSRWLERRAAGRAPAPDYFLRVPATGFGGEGFTTIVSSDDPPPLGCGAGGGLSVRWFDFASPGGDVGWRAYFTGQDGVPNGGIDAFGTALAAWRDDPNTLIRYVFQGLTVATGGLSAFDGVNAILFGDPNDEVPGSFDGQGLLALGGPWFDCGAQTYMGESFHPILGADIVTQDGLELFFASTPDPENAAEQLFAHELGHTLGLGHSEEPDALMRGLFHPDRRGAALDVDDLAGAQYLYGPRDLTPPAAPSELMASLTEDGEVLLEWSDNSDDESVFWIERRQDAGFEPVTTAGADAESLIDAAVAPDTLYGYRLRAQNGAGASPFSTVVEILTGEDRRPAAPSGLRAAPLSSTEVRLAWQDNSDDETGFIVEILIPPVWVEIPVQLAPDTRKVIVEGLPSSTGFSFRVRAVNAFGASEASNQANVSTFSNNNDCVVSSDQLCLLGGRFKVTVDFRNQHAGGVEGTGTVVPSTDETGLFWFFGPENVELIVKVLDGRPINQHFWVFYGALSDVEYWITVTDTATGAMQVYHNPPGQICGAADTTAFDDDSGEPLASERRVGPRWDVSDLGLVAELGAESPPAKSGSCAGGPNTLCLLGGRLAAEVWWRDPRDPQSEGPGQAIADSDNTGMFWFFNIENTELVVKALDGGALNGHLWLFYGALTDLEYWLTVTDTLTGASRVYYNPPGAVCGGVDLRAFLSD